jgi:hypothetical protein
MLKGEIADVLAEIAREQDDAIAALRQRLDALEVQTKAEMEGRIAGLLAGSKAARSEPDDVVLDM